MLQKKNSKVTNIQSIGVEKDYFAEIFKENSHFLREHSEKNVKSQIDVNLVFTEDFIKIIQILKEKVSFTDLLLRFLEFQ